MKKPFVISISGLSGSGKTESVKSLKERLAHAAVISFDDYGDRVYLDRDINEWSADSSDNEWHTEPVAADVERLLGKPLDYIILDFPFGYGNKLVGQYINLAVFIDVPLDVALARRIIRDYTSRDQNTHTADVEEVSLAGLDKELRFYLARSRSTYARMPEMQKPASDLVIDGTKTPVEIADEIMSRINICRSCDIENKEIYIKIAVESDLPCVLHVDPFQRMDFIARAIKHGDCYIALSDDVIKAFAVMDYSFFDNAFIELLMVAEKDRRCGFGSALLNYLFAVCKTQKLFTSTNQSNLPMQNLLHKTGFTYCGKVDALDEGDPELFYIRMKENH
ncbi:MAG: GNAT family N-acetyltransferase [Clostridiaceae bacterium]|nr:GNAT family N-acetyltransferase [Clostridiaceae bacterium]